MALGCASGRETIGFSVVIASRGRPAALRTAVAAAGRQTFPPAEIVVVNDGGAVADGGRETLRSLARGAPVRGVALLPGLGQVAARNVGVAVARASHVALLDDDDAWLPDHLAALATALADGAALAHTDAEVALVDRSHSPWRVLDRRLFALAWDEAFARRYNPVIPSSLAYRRDLHARLGPFSTASGHHWDWEFLLRALAAGERPRRVARATALYSVDSAGANESARADEMRDSVRRLAQARGLATTHPHTFWTMLDEPDVRARTAPSERRWDGRWPTPSA
jgi:glycosyltransferase involved in cell wall biosynthesis